MPTDSKIPSKYLFVSEAQHQRAILDYLQRRGYFCWRNNTGANRSIYKGKERFFQYGKVGSGDIFLLTKAGRFCSIEVKRQDGKPSPHQVEFMRRVNESGGLAFVAHNVDEVLAQGL